VKYYGGLAADFGRRPNARCAFSVRLFAYDELERLLKSKSLLTEEVITVVLDAKQGREVPTVQQFAVRIYTAVDHLTGPGIYARVMHLMAKEKGNRTLRSRPPAAMSPEEDVGNVTARLQNRQNPDMGLFKSK
jgi:hypothetical protein